MKVTIMMLECSFKIAIFNKKKKLEACNLLPKKTAKKLVQISEELEFSIVNVHATIEFLVLLLVIEDLRSPLD